jgi:thiamine biosynthesis lipoprotein ApbE
MRKTKGVYSIILVTLLAAGTVVLVVYMSKGGENNGEPKGTYHSPTVFAMDTSLDITIQGRSKDQAKADVDAAVALARRRESHTSRFKQESDVFQINANAGVAPVKVNLDTMYLVQKSVEYGAKTGGAFDITVAPIVGLWGFYDQKYRIPSQEEINNALALVDYRKIAIDQAGGTVMLPEKGMQIDMGGVAKGYAVEQMYNLLKQRGVKSGLISATVVGPDAMAADILAKAPIVMGPQKGLELVQAQPGFDALAIDSSGSIQYTAEMKQKYVVSMLPHI